MKKTARSSKGNKGPLSKKGTPKRITAKTSKSSKSLAKTKAGLSETKEERERRLARRKALTLLAFQMAYDNYHQN